MTRSAGVLIGAAIVLTAASYRVDAHKPVTSKYTYTHDVLPIIQHKCADCHRPGGVAPMSLLTYEDAFPWAESIRAEIIAGHMPPAPADPTFGAIQHNRILTADEADILLTWATGGNPKGPDVPSSAPPAEPKWTLGAPDLVLKLPETVTLPADKSEDTREFVLPLQTSERHVRAVDVLPGTPAMVRNVTVSIKGAAGTGDANADTVLCRWAPGQTPVDLAKEGASFELPAGAAVAVRIHYKKTWQYDGKPLDDNTAIGLYFTDAHTRPLTSLPLDAAKPLAAGEAAKFTVDVPRDVDAFGVRIDDAPADEVIEVAEIGPSGREVPLLRFTARPNWQHRYWFARPVPLTQGSRIQVRATYQDPALVADAFGGVNKTAAAAPTPLHLALDVAARP